MNTNRRSLFILTFVLFVVMLGWGIILPILPFYVEQLGAGGMELGLLVASYAVMRLVFGPVWGGLSDRLGRKPVLLIGILGYGITMVWFGLATRLWMLFAARILSGILSSATAPTTLAYIGDSTPEKQRGGGMGLLGAAGGIGTILGPAFGGLLGGRDLSTPFFAAAGLAFLSLLLGWLFLPESLPATERHKPGPESRILDARLWLRSVRGPLGTLFFLTFISTCGLMIFANIFGLYTLRRFNFGAAEVGLMMMVLGLVSAVGQGVLSGPLTRRWGDVALIRAGLLGTAVAFGLVLLARDAVSILLATAFFGLSMALQTPALNSLTSRRGCAPQGVVMGLSNSFVSLGRIIGPLFAGAVFDANTLLPYAGGSLVMVAGFLVSLTALRGDAAEDLSAASAN